MFGIGETELLIIVAFGFMIFGPDKLPGMGRTIGRALRQFRQAQEGFTEVVQTEVMDPLQEAMGDPLDTGTRKQRRATAEERAAALAADADIEVAEGEAAPRKETFAERKARLAAEREAREAAAAAAATEAQPADEDASASETEEASEAPVAETAPEPELEPEAPDTSAAALYGLSGRSSFSAAKEQEAAEAARETAAKEQGQAAKEQEQAADDEAAKTADGEAADAPTDGKEAGSDEA